MVVYYNPSYNPKRAGFLIPQIALFIALKKPTKYVSSDIAKTFERSSMKKSKFGKSRFLFLYHHSNIYLLMDIA